MRKRMLSIMLAVVVTFTAMGSNVSAAELGAAVDESIQTQTEETETADAESETEKQEEESAVEDTDAGFESGRQDEEGTAEDTNTGSESEGQEAGSDNEDSKENETDDETKGESQESGDDSTATEDIDDESEDSEEEADADSFEEDETKIGAGVAEMSLTTSDTDIASGQYTENGSNVVWVIDANGKLTVEGTGEFTTPGFMRSNAPWYESSEYIKSAEIKVTGMTDASKMFASCTYLTSVDLSNFDTSSVTNMSMMFYNCWALESLDLSNFNTSNVTDMSGMFRTCHCLTSLDLSSFNTSNVTNMCEMFGECGGLTSLDLSNFDTSNVTNMDVMFETCMGLTSLDLSNFDTSNVTSMEGMFRRCYEMISLDLSNFNTSNVTSMEEMFRYCEDLISVDLSNFDTSNVTNMNNMFYHCESLVSLDLSSFNLNSANATWGMFDNCSGLTTIYTPYSNSSEISLPKRVDSDIWYDCEGRELSCLPVDRSYSTVITKNKKPLTTTIAVTKIKTFYNCGDTLNIDDLKVYYYDDKGSIEKITEGYSTNVDEIDMHTSGRKILEITYNGMTAEVEIIVGTIYTVSFVNGGAYYVAGDTPNWVLENENYTFTLLKKDGYTYTVTATMGEKNVTPSVDETGNTYTISNVTADLNIIINATISTPTPGVEDTSGVEVWVNCEDNTYTGSAIKPGVYATYNGKELTEGIDYTLKYTNNIKVGTAKITVTGKGNFAGSNSSTTFEIMPRDIADVTLCGVAADADGKETLTLASGAALTPVLYYNNIKLTNKDYVIKDASGTEIAGKKLSDSDNNTAIKIEGKSGGNFTGSREVKLNVVDKKNLTKFTVTVDTTKLNTLTYDGDPHYIHEISGAITAKASDAAKTNMEYGKDYTIVYPSDVISAGIKKFTVVGRGFYTGSVSKSYTIKPAKEAALSVYYDGSIVTGNKITTPFTFASSGITLSSKLTVADGNGNALSEGRDYKVSYSGNKQVGTKAKCTITFLGNYKGHAKQIVGFEIAKADLSKAEVIIADKAYTGKAGIYKSVPYVIEDKDEANVLLKSSNYKTTYYTEDPTNHDNAAQMKGKNKVGAGGTVWVKLEAKGKNYSGTQIVSYKVREVAYDLSKAKITFKDTEGKTVKKMPYTGSKITDKHIKAVVNGNLAENNEDIEVIYVDNIKKGKATVIIKGTDTDTCAYAGCKTAAFSIVARSFSLH